MPRYFFHTHIGAEVIPDPVGAELRDPDAAWETARDLARAALREGGDQARLLSACLVVVDADGEIVLEFPVSEAVSVRPGDPRLH